MCLEALRVPRTTRRSNQSILREINPKYSLGGLMLKLYFCHLMWTADSLEKSLMLGKMEGIKGWDGCMASTMQWTWTWANSGDGEGQRGLASAVHGAAKGWTWLGDSTTGQKYSSYPLTLLTMSHIIYSFLSVSSFLPSILFLPTLIIRTQSLITFGVNTGSCTAGGFFTSWAITEDPP